MSFRVVLWQSIGGFSEFNVSSITITDNMLIKGKFRTPITNIKYIEEV